MTVIQLPLPGIFEPNRETPAGVWCTVSEAAPVAAMLRAYRDLWMRNPLWLCNVPGVTDPRRDRWQAIDDAWRIIDRDEQRSGRQAKPITGKLKARSCPDQRAALSTSIVGSELTVRRR